MQKVPFWEPQEAVPSGLTAARFRILLSTDCPDRFFIAARLALSVLKKTIALFVFNDLTFGVFSLIGWDFEDRGVVPCSNFDFGAAYYQY